MNLSFAMLASSADITNEGNLWIAGADFDMLSCQGIPESGTPLLIQASVIAKFVVSPEELQNDHHVAISVTKPNGERLDLQGPYPLTVGPNRLDRSKSSSSAIVARLFLALDTLGEYTFHIIADDVEVKTLPLTIVAGQPNITTNN